MRKFSLTLISFLLIAALFFILISLDVISLSVFTAKSGAPGKMATLFASERRRERQYQIAVPETLTIHNPLGKIIVRGDEIEHIDLKAVTRARSATPGRTKDLLEQIKIETETTEGFTCINILIPDISEREQIFTDLYLRVPFGPALNLLAGTGNVEVDGVGGNLQVQSDLGSIKLRRFTGNAALESALGNIEVSDSFFFRELMIIAHLGDILLQADPAETTVLESDLGDIEIHLSGEGSYILEGHLRSGGINLDVPFTGQHGETQVSGIIGQGEQRGSLFVKLELGSLSLETVK